MGYLDKLKPAILPEDVVPHPRFGSKPIRSEDWILPSSSCWWYSHRAVFPESAIPADISRQNYSCIPVVFYVDVLEHCIDCNRPFIFFAKEQKHWYEDLGFGLDSWAVRCPVCRKTDRTLRRRFDRYSQAIVRKNLNDKEFALLVGDAAFLWEQGVLRNRDKLLPLRKHARLRLPRHAATAELERALETPAA